MHRKSRPGFRAIAATLAAFAAGSAGAQELAVNGPLALDRVSTYARAHNPELEAARRRAAAAEAVPPRVAAYDDPTFTYETWNAPESLRIDRADNNILKLSQRVPFPGKRRLAGAVAERDADMARQEAESVELEVIAAVKRAYYELWRLHQNLDVYSRDKGLVERFARIAEAKYGVGEVSQPDVLRAQVELTRLINRVTTEQFAVDSARAELNALLSRGPEEPLGDPEDPPPPRLEETPGKLIELALVRRPDVKAQAASVAREEKNLRLARLNYLPDFEFTASRFINAAGRDGFGAMVSISIPIAYKYKYDAGVEEASARLEAARSEQRRVRDRVQREVEQAFLRARTAHEQHELFVTTHIPQAEEALRASEAAYQTGRIDFLSLIDSVRAIEAVHVEHYAAAADFEKAYAELERAVGTELPRVAAVKEGRR